MVAHFLTNHKCITHALTKCCDNENTAFFCTRNTLWSAKLRGWISKLKNNNTQIALTIYSKLLPPSVLPVFGDIFKTCTALHSMCVVCFGIYDDDDSLCATPSFWLVLWCAAIFVSLLTLWWWRHLISRRLLEPVQF